MASAELSRRVGKGLFPQPDGFECLSCVCQHIANDLAPSQGENASGERIYSRSAGLASSPKVSQRDDLIAASMILLSRTSKVSKASVKPIQARSASAPTR
jgi:hypothetical protein